MNQKRIISIILAVMAIIVAVVYVHRAHTNHAEFVIQEQGMQIKNPYIYALPPERDTTAGYAVIANHGNVARVLQSVHADFANVEIHQTIIDNGIAKMRPLSHGLSLAVGESVTLTANANHFMFLDMHPVPKVGDTLPTTFFFDNLTMSVDFVVIDRFASEHVH